MSGSRYCFHNRTSYDRSYGAAIVIGCTLLSIANMTDQPNELCRQAWRLIMRSVKSVKRKASSASQKLEDLSAASKRYLISSG